MKKILLQIFAVLLALAIVPAGLLFFAFGLPTQFENTFLAELPDKCRLLEETEGRRIVVIGGSGAAFGLRCDLLEEALPGYSAVNFGMYAGLGTVVMLDLVLPRLREGDVVIFSPEQSEQTLSAYLGGQYLWQAAEGNLKILSSLRPEDRCTMLGAFPYFAAQKARFFRDGTTPSGEGVYAHSSFNRYGDIDYPNRETNVMVNGWDENMPISFDEQLLQEDFLNRFCSFVAQCEKKGIRVFYRFCPMNAAAISSEERTHIRAFEDALKEKINCPILGDADSAILDAGWFYDTNFHLNSAGAVVNTARLAQQLQKALNISGSTIALPGMPGTVQAQEVPGDDRDADCFQYRQTEKGIVIVGLMTDQKSLTLPTFAHGEAVVGFTEEAFAGNTTVEEIVLQSNITSIPDGALFGCTNLKRLVVMNTSPSACTVGAGLLEGTNAHIFVPGESYGSYVTNYFWSVHASRIRQNKLYQPEQQEEAELPPISGQSIRYMGNGGVTKDGKNYFDKPMDTAHLRVNTALGTRYFERPGYIPVGWNTEPDGSGKRVGFGSRTERRKDRILYAQWVRETPGEYFETETRGDQIWITGYSGSDTVCAIPETLNGLPVAGVCSGAFAQSRMEILVLPPQMKILASGAFAGCGVKEIYLFDSVEQIGDDAFESCDDLQTLHVNAAENPRFSTSYYAVFADKYDYLLSLSGQKKIVLFSGSSTRYGFDSTAIEKAYPEYGVVNMGVFAYTNALPQLELIRKHTDSGDILLHAPEFDPLDMQFCCENKLDHHFWAMMEANYDAAAQLDLREYSGVFDSFRDFLSFRSGMPILNYSASPSGFDDEGNRYGFPTYNRNGDYILPRPNGDTDALLQRARADYTTSPFTPACLASINREYDRFLEDGVAVYFTYTPRNRSSLTENSTPEARAELAALLGRELHASVISDLEGSLYPGQYFYLIDSHLSTEGVWKYTQRIIDDLRPWIRRIE